MSHSVIVLLDKIIFSINDIFSFFYTRILTLVGYVVATPPFVADTMLLFNEKRGFLIVTVSHLLLQLCSTFYLE